MKRFTNFFTYAILALVVAIGGYVALSAFSAPAPPQKIRGPYYDNYTNTLTNTATVYHTLQTTAGKTAYLEGSLDVSVQINLDSTSGDGTTVLTIEGTNDIESNSPAWVTIGGPFKGWTINEDTLIQLADIKYASLRFKYAHSGTGVDAVRTDWIVKE